MGSDPRFAAVARDLGDELAARRIGLVYGGGSLGLMGVVADAVLNAGGEVIGVIPQALKTEEIAHAGLTKLHVVASMHERKALMASLSDAFIALPGGLGTFDELLEMLTWLQLGIHQKPVALLDVATYWTGLRQLLSDAVANGFVHEKNARSLLVETTPHALLDAMKTWTPPPLPRLWLKQSDS
jgi:uncharacterized protein (TIGR00730 family)